MKSKECCGKCMEAKGCAELHGFGESVLYIPLQCSKCGRIIIIKLNQSEAEDIKQ